MALPIQTRQLTRTHAEEDSGIMKNKVEFQLSGNLAGPFRRLERFGFKVLEHQEQAGVIIFWIADSHRLLWRVVICDIDHRGLQVIRD